MKQPTINPTTQAFKEEQKHFAKTLSIIRQERQKAEEALGMEGGQDRLIHVLDDSSGEAVVEQFLTRIKLRTLHQLRLSQANPYFARVDFTPAQGKGAHRPTAGMRPGEKQAVYIGRWGIIKTPEYRVWVADWRSPVANLYYSGQIGPVRYDAPDGPVEGDLSLKRMFTLEEGQLVAMQDTGLAAQERFLTEALSQVTTAKLREVVTTLQAEQNLIIRFDPLSPLCVQGVAGSGKTTIALHRIAWILYRLQKTVTPNQMMIIAPNPLFLTYISRVLPDLGVEEVRQTTFLQLCKGLLGKHMPKTTHSARLEERLRLTKAQRDALDDILRRKGAVQLAGELDAFLSRLEGRIPPKEDVAFGGRTLLTAAEMADLFLRQLRHFPLEARVGEVRKVLLQRLAKLTEELEAALHRLTDEKLEGLLQLLPDGEERRSRVTRLLASREERLGQLKTAREAFLKGYDGLWPKLNLLEVYGQFWEGQAAQNPDCMPLWQAAQPLLAQGKAAAEDLPALLWLAQGLYGLKPLDVRHVVVDEAQDVSPLQVKVLRRLAGHDAFTLVGDLCQGVYGDEGIRSWEDLRGDVFAKEPTVATLSTSYRSTVEIMEVALGILRRRPLEGVSQLGSPVLRHGPKPDFWAVGNEGERVQAVANAALAWQREGFFSIAVLVKEEGRARKLHKALKALLPQARLITQGDESLQGGVQVMSASLVKGLEFDCVFIADAQPETYPDEGFYAKLLYVLCTRPLHRLALAGLVRPKGEASGLPGLSRATAFTFYEQKEQREQEEKGGKGMCPWYN